MDVRPNCDVPVRGNNACLLGAHSQTAIRFTDPQAKANNASAAALEKEKQKKLCSYIKACCIEIISYYIYCVFLYCLGSWRNALHF